MVARPLSSASCFVSSSTTGHVNPQTLKEAHQYHQLILELTPYHLTISPLDIDHVELLYGFDLECENNHDQVVYEALHASGQLAGLQEIKDGKIIDCQPMFRFALTEDGSGQATFEVETRARGKRGTTSRTRHEPISLFLSLCHYGPVDKLEDLKAISAALSKHAERLAMDRLVPDLLLPISRQITSSNK